MLLNSNSQIKLFLSAHHTHDKYLILYTFDLHCLLLNVKLVKMHNFNNERFLFNFEGCRRIKCAYVFCKKK